MKKIVVLDGYPLNPGDLSWKSLAQVGETIVYERSSEAEILSRIADADIVLTNKAILSEAAIKVASKLTYIGVMATGYNVVDLNAAKTQNITVTNVPAYSTASVAQLTMNLMLELSAHFSFYAQSVQQGDWERCADFSYQLKPIIELQGKTLGIIGLGQIGKKVAEIALAFGMKIIASHKHPERDRMDGVDFVDEKTCFQTADFISLHCPLNDQNKNFVNTALIRGMKPSAFLINTSRGGLIHENDLADALNSGQIAGAGLDVLSVEPPGSENPLLKAKNCIVTPHIGWASIESRKQLMATLVNNIKGYLEGAPVNVVG
jgi:glycerate dehydrogenase